jgi:hypothetical protein
MMEDKVVVRYKDKRLFKGKSSDFACDKAVFHLRLLNGKVEIVQTEDLKAVFMVESLEGNKNYICAYKDFIPWAGHKIKVEFIDGEVMIGYTPYYPEGNRNFFITPADLQCNNKMVYVVNSATKHIYYM